MIRVGIFTKMSMAGGSEFRAVEMATTISQIPGYHAVLLVEKSMASRLRPALGEGVEVHENIFTHGDLEPLYALDHLLVINTDSRDFTNADYWLGKTSHHTCAVDLTRIRQMVFLFNFIVSPACHLPSLRAIVPDVRIITANGKFFHEIGEQDRYLPVRHYPRLQLESPINPGVAQPKTASERIRLGMHSLAASSKWNEQWPDLIYRLNGEFPDQITWDFMGMPKDLAGKIRANNVRIRKEFDVPVAQFLQGLDVFVFFSSWKREEPWARSAGEALMSGCPVLATRKGGNSHQVIHGNTGFLCKDFDAFVGASRQLILDPDLLTALQANAQRLAQQFSSEEVLRKFLAFIR